ncbi:MAG: PadR family transcriptional regulator [bacterium]|nr:PadR family transcriptional regulator [bacterium]
MILTNVEFSLAELIAESGEISGYDINKLIEERGYRQWADIGTTSVYLGLEKLKKKKLVRSFLDTRKKGKGPPPRKYALNESGHEVLKENVLEALSNRRERDRRFDLGIAGLPFVRAREASGALKKRRIMLTETAEKIKEKFQKDGGENLPLHVRALFNHPLFLIRHELEFLDSLLIDLEKQ